MAQAYQSFDQVKGRIGQGFQRVNRFWAGEEEVAATFLSEPRTVDEHLYWLKSQMVRELGWPDGRLSPVVKAFKDLESEQERHYVHTLYLKAEEEYSHYVVLADIAEEMAGRRILPEEIQYNRDLPETVALAKIRTRGTSGWDSAVSGFHEGGGLGIYYTCMHLEPMEQDPWRPKIAMAMGMIYDDELAHAASGFKEMVHVAATVNDDEWVQVMEKVDLVGYHRVRMRNEQFGFILSEERVQEIKAGKIEPFMPPLPPLKDVYEQITASEPWVINAAGMKTPISM